MKNNIKKAPVKFQGDLLYFSAFYADFCLCPESMIITTLSTFSTSRILTSFAVQSSGLSSSARFLCSYAFIRFLHWWGKKSSGFAYLHNVVICMLMQVGVCLLLIFLKTLE